ncbi:hypothetical protein BDV96DRAFT_379808 [Lophiotrema nucula]|uniref:DUF6594 domain-containing protein n=1 Tax=Lophiotrema nucula TaxID=690887 RepID=A0A6A5ZFD5_9PLEO|nr:hypothetical protein BDV96DRAFT_379808 [Lophiotrema nucula]
MSTYPLSHLPPSTASNTRPMGSPVANPSSSPRQPPGVSAASGNPRDRSDEYVKGYPRLAYFFAECPRYFHLRSFSALSVRALLYRQHQLAYLEEQLIALENEDSRDPDPYRAMYNRDFGKLVEPPPGHEQQVVARCELYEKLIKRTKEYEKALLRFEQLGSKGRNSAALENVQRWLMDPEGCDIALTGLDGGIWGTVDDPAGHAPDLIAVVQQPESSIIEGFLGHRFLTWSRRLPTWLRCLVFWSNKQPDDFGIWSHRARSFKVVSLAMGNIATSIFVYGAVVSLSFVTSQAFGLLIILPIALAVTSCYLLFQNQQFISMLATLCAVLVALLANNDAREPHNAG